MSVSEDGDALMRGPARAVDELDAQRALANVAAGLLGRPAEPARVGRFILLSRIGAGGMGVVYSAFDPQLDRKVAIKLLHPQAAKDDGQARLLREARTLARLSHPHVVTIHEAGTFQDRLFLAMELVIGEPLSRWMEEPRPWREAVRVLMQAGEGLAAAHEAGIVHRDFKPGNAIRGDDGRVQVLDFGLARADEPSPSLESEPSEDGVDPTDVLTRRGAVIGTPAYMAPEQHRGEPATAASDQFGFCVSLYEAITGQRPFVATSRAKLLIDIEDGNLAPTPADRPMPGWLRRALLRGLRPEPGQRWPSMRALLDALQRGLSPRWRRALLPVVIIGAAVAATPMVMAGDGTSCEEVGSAIDRVWNPEVAGGMVAALGALEHPNAQATPARVAEELDAYARAWTTARVDACERERLDPTRAAPRDAASCLDGQLQWVSTTIDLLRAPDVQVLVDAPNLVPRTSDLESCRPATEADPDAPRLPVQADLRGEIEKILAEAAALGRAERHEDALRVAHTALTQAEEADDDGLRARAQRLMGQLHRHAGDHAQAIERYQAAVVSAERGGDTVARLDALRGLSLELIETARTDEAQRLVEQVEAAHVRFDPRPWHWDAELEVLRTELAMEREDGERAVEHAQRHLALVQDNAGHDPHRTLRARGMLARSLLLADRLDDALAQWEQVHEKTEQLYGPVHSRAAVALSASGVIHWQQGRRDQATKALLRSLSIRKQLHGPDHPSLIKILINIAVVQATKNPGVSRQALENAVRIAQAHRRTHERQLASSLHSLGGVLKQLGLHEPALERLVQAYEINREFRGEAHPRSVLALYDVGEAQWSLKRYDDAIESFGRALEIERRERGADSPNLLFGVNGLTKAHDLAGHPEQARRFAEEAVRLAARPDASPRMAISAYHALVELLLDQRDEATLDRAESLVEAAEALCDRPRVPGSYRRFMVRQRAKLERVRAGGPVDLPED